MTVASNFKLKLNLSSSCFNHQVLGGLYDYQLTRFTEWFQLCFKLLHLQTALHMLIAWESTHTFIYSCSSNTYPIILLLEVYICIPDLCFAGLACSRVVFIIFHGKLRILTVLSWGSSWGRIHAMNNVIITKWHIALSTDIGVLENHWRKVQVLWSR